ncbi:MAG TPA: protein kinase [Gemmataceae bacterium]|nr:protein kinase [Gemmataceae bacterium]
MSPDLSGKGPKHVVQVGKYRVTAHLATGGMGAVYKAYDPEAKRDVALKVLPPEMAAKPIMIERFRREAKHAAKLRHENIVKLYDFGDADGCFYIAMEFVEGVDLMEYLERKGQLEPGESLEIITQAATALSHAHRRGIVHRDVKPSNFLVTRKKGKLLIKLADLGLSREARTEEFRVTRAGTTVGTVDYISPEQACDSSKADVRSDLYSLGCTWHHLLTGRAPFAEGGLAERLQKHLNAEPPDVRLANPRVTPATAAVLRRLLAKKPADRHQTADELLDDLKWLAGGARPLDRQDVLRGLLDGEDDPPRPRPVKRADDSDAPASSRLPSRASKPVLKGSAKPKAAELERQPSTPDPRRLYIIGGVAGGILVAVVTAVVLQLRTAHSTANTDAPAHKAPTEPPPSLSAAIVPPANPGVGDPKPSDKPPDKPLDKPADKPHFPLLDPTARPVDVADLRQTIEEPWVGRFQRPADALVLHVARAPDGGGGLVYPTLAEAAAAAPVDRLSVIEIDDDGPLFETATAFGDRSLILCAGAGFRPLIVWDASRSAADAGKPLLSVERGGLRLENLDIAYDARNAAGGVPILDAHDADLWADGCSFSVAHKPHDSVVVAHFHGARPDAALCRFSRCYIRGPAVTAVEVNAPGAMVLFDRSLIVGGDPPLIQVHAADARPTFLTAARSTLVCGHNLLSIQRAADSDRKPSVAWLGWDCLLSRSSEQSGGDMVLAPMGDGVSTSGMQWKAFNCLYAGWKNLLAGPETISGADVAAWRTRWGRIDGDASTPGGWPTDREDPSVRPAATFRTADTPVGFAATAAPDGPLGCELTDLPPTRDKWQGLTDQAFVLPPFDAITDDAARTVSQTADGFYHGGAIDLGKPNFDLGAFLRDLQDQHKLAPRVVLQLSGPGEHPFTPFHLHGCTLVLCAEATKGDVAPVTLLWTGVGAIGQDGLIEIEDGGLDLINVGLKMTDFPGAAAPEHILKVRGQLRLFRCRLEGLQQNLSEPYRGLIDVQGSGDPAPTAACASAILESVLISGRDGVRLRGVGAWLLLRQSVLVAGRDALHIDPGPSWAGRANGQCVLDHATIAARRSVVHLDDAVRQTDAPPADPYMVRSRDCAYLNPFSDKSGPSGMLCFEKSALAHGLLIWQGSNDAFSKRMAFAAAPATALPDKEESRAAWTRLWGSYGDDHAAADVWLPKLFDAPPWPLDRLALKPPAGSSEKHAPGADLAQLGLLKRPTKPH